MRTLNMTAYTVTIDPESEGKVNTEVTMSDSEYFSVLQGYDTTDIVREVGVTELLDNMDTEAIMAYLNDLGVKTEWEEIL